MCNIYKRMLLFIGIICIQTDAAENLPVLFSGTYINNAWGYRHEGWLIDSSGAVRTFEFVKNDSMDYDTRSDTVPSRIFGNLLVKSIPTGRKIPSDTLLMMKSLIEPASGGVVTFGGGCCDYGVFRYSAYMAVNDPSRIREINCYQYGDEWSCNSSLEAKKIARWLNTIDTSDLENCQGPDSCLNPPTAIRPVQTALPGTVRPSSSATVNLNGKKVDGIARQMIVGKGKKKLIGFHDN
jgi:hypothetical protein